jgi:hydrogenase maturation protease
MTPPVLVFGWGNLSRGDDALGPLCVERLRGSRAASGAVEFLDDYQLQVEHALDLAGRRHVLFIDASFNACAPFEVTPLSAAADVSTTTHALSPQSLLHVYGQLHGVEPPPCTLLAIRGDNFELGAAPSGAAQTHLVAALEWAENWLSAATASVHAA